MMTTSRKGTEPPPQVLGVEIGPRRLRVSRAGRGRRRSPQFMEVEWGSPPPEESVAALVERFGGGNTLAVCLDPSFLFVKRLELPPLPPQERRRMIGLDPARYFPVRDEPLAAGVRDDDLVVATRESLLDAWVGALAALGTVERVEPAPSALARYLREQGMDTGVLALMDPSTSGAAVATLRDGEMDALRKVPGTAAEVADVLSALGDATGPRFLHPWSAELGEVLGDRSGDPALRPLPAGAHAPAEYAASWGAALGLDDGDALSIVSPGLQRRVLRASRRRAVLHLAALAASLVALGWSVDHRRTRVLESLEREVVAAEDRAQPVLDVRARAESLAAELTLMADVAESREDPLTALLALTRLLPSDAYVTQLYATGGDWELAGLAPDAAALIPILEGSELFEDVRFRTATTRVTVRGESLERFNITLRHVAAT